MNYPERGSPRSAFDDSFLILKHRSLPGAAPFARGALEWSANDLLRLQEWLHLTVQSPEVGFWEWDVSTDQIEISYQWRELQGFTNPETSPRTVSEWLELVHPDDRPACDRFVADIKAAPGVTHELDFRLQHPDGSYGWQHSRGKLTRLATGRSVVVGTVVEITAQREALSRLHQVERLEAIGQLTGGLAHDFNNLLTVVQGNVELLRDDLGENPQVEAILEEICSVVTRGSAVTRRLLNFARSDADHGAAATDPDRLTRGLLPLLEHALGGAVALRTDLAARGWGIKADHREFENAILNLAINARDAMPNGGDLTISSRPVRLRAVDVDAAKDETPGAYIMIGVSDTGQGMTPEVLSRVFEPFFTTKAEKGTGLGVPMVARFARETAGFVRYESALGVGTTVRLYLPRAR